MTIRKVLPFFTASLAFAGCVNDIVVIGGGGPPEGGGDPVGGAPPAVQGTSPDLDLLIVVDNSIGMVAKQQQLAGQIEVLIRGLIDPPCVTNAGEIVPADGDICGPGAARQFSPIRSLHVGVVTSSLGDLTAGTCAAVPNADDHGHLVDRDQVTGGQGFLSYEIGDGSVPDDLIAKTSELILGAGQVGCGYEMPLEAMARFLMDPDPYDALVSDGDLSQAGTDQVVLQQRAAFLRPTSSVAVLVLSDENDCSIDVGGSGFLTLRTTPFYRATAVCEIDENDECCTSCALAEESGCSLDGCPEGADSKYAAADDPANLRCWDQKRRYGVDFRYPVQRYVNALSSTTIDRNATDLASGPNGSEPNPLFAGGRDPSQVTFLTMGGVPWQDIVIDPNDNGSRYRTADELTASGTWDWLTGPNPSDPFMVEDVDQRSGLNPANGADVSIDNNINGGDFPITDGSFLQFSCLFPLAEPIPQSNICGDCIADACENPACDGDMQIYGHAFPPSRQLEVARGLGSRGRVASVCRELDDHSAMDAMLIRVAQTLE